MKVPLSVAALLLVAISADAAPRAALCTKDVPTQTCDTEKAILNGLQPLYLASDVQYVIADNDAYTAELNRISEMKKALVLATHSNDDAAFQNTFNGVFRELEDSILIEYSDDNHSVSKVYLNAKDMETVKGVETKDGKIEAVQVDGSYEGNNATYLNCVSLGFIRGFYERGSLR